MGSGHRLCVRLIHFKSLARFVYLHQCNHTVLCAQHMKALDQMLKPDQPAVPELIPEECVRAFADAVVLTGCTQSRER